MKQIDPDDEATFNKFMTFAHAFADIKGLNFPDESIEEHLLNGFLDSLPDDSCPAVAVSTEAPKVHADTMVAVGWFIGLRDKPRNGPAIKLGKLIYETYTDASKALDKEFNRNGATNVYRSGLAPYSERIDYQIVPIYRAV